MSGFGVAALAAAVVIGMPSSAQAVPRFVTSPDPVDFGQVAPGGSKDLVVTLTNEGTSTAVNDVAQIVQIAPFLPPADSQFQLVQPGGTCGLFIPQMNKGDSCTLLYRFSPTSSAPAASSQTVFLGYNQDSDGPGPNPPVFVQRSVEITFTGNVTCGGLPATKVGTSGDDTITGTSGNDVIAGLGGDDTISGLDGNDIICGGSSSDVLDGGRGRDTLYGDSGADVLRGGKNKDRCIGGTGIDRAKKCEKAKQL